MTDSDSASALSPVERNPPGAAGEGDGEAVGGSAAEAPDTSASEATTTYLLERVARLLDAVEDLEPADKVGTALRGLTEQIEQSRRNEWRPIYIDLILLLDRVDNSALAWQSEPSVTEFLCTVRDEIIEILARRGVVPMVFADDAFDATRQRAVRVAHAEDPFLDRRVASVVRRGYEHEGYVLRPEEVVVARYSAPTASS